MSEMNLFEMATRGKYRFPFKGSIMAEDLFDLDVTNLDSIFKTLNAQLKVTKEESLLTVKTAQDKELAVKIEIVKTIVAEKIAELDRVVKARELKAQKQKIMALIAEKQEDSLKGKSIEELQALMENLN